MEVTVLSVQECSAVQNQTHKTKEIEKEFFLLSSLFRKKIT